jgi:hypothetical protein
VAPEWTVETLKEHFETLLEAYDLRYGQRFIAQELAVKDALVGQEKAVTAALVAADRAVAKAETAAEKRFESVNEFRAQLKDQQIGLLSRAEADAEFRAIREIITSQAKEIAALREYRSETGGRGQGIDNSWRYLVSGVGLMLTLLTIGSILFALLR